MSVLALLACGDNTEPICDPERPLRETWDIDGCPAALLVDEAHRVGTGSIAITDRDGVYGMVRAHVKAKELGVHLLCGAQLTIAPPGSALAASTISSTNGHGWGLHSDDVESPHATGRRGRTKRAKPRQPMLELEAPAVGAPSTLTSLATDRAGWANLTRLLTIGRRRLAS